MCGDAALRVGELERVKKRQRFIHGKARKLVDILAAHRNRKRLGLEPLAAAGFAVAVRHKTLQRFPLPRGIGLVVAAAHLGEQAGPSLVVHRMPLARLLVVHKPDCVLAAVEQRVPLRLGKLFVGRVQRVAVRLGQRLKAAAVPLGIGIKRREPAFVKRQAFVGNHQVNVKLHLFAQPRAFGTRPKGIVKRKKARLQFGNGDAAVRAGVFLRKKFFALGSTFRARRTFGIPPRYHDDAARTCQGRLNRIGYAFTHLVGQRDAVNDQLDGVFFLLVQFNRTVQVNHQPVDARADIAHFFCVLKDFLVLALFAANHRRKNLYARARAPAHNRVDDVVGGLLFYDAPAAGAVRDAGTREQQAVVIENFRNRAHG